MYYDIMIIYVYIYIILYIFLFYFADIILLHYALQSTENRIIH